MPFRYLATIPVLALSLLAIGHAPVEGRVAPLDRPVPRSAPFSLFGYPGETIANQEAWEAGVRQAAWDEGVWRAGVEAAEVERRAAEEVAARRAATAGATRNPTPTPTVTSGDCASVAAIIGWGIVNRESGGNPSAVNASSGAYGCSQTLPSHYAGGGACAGLDMYSVAGQTACTQILYDRGGLNPWALTR